MARRNQPLSPKFEMLAGDTAESLLSALDYVAFVIPKRANPQALEANPAQVNFPIIPKRPHPKGQPGVVMDAPDYGGKIKLWPAQARRHIVSVQPYACPGGYMESPSHHLKDLAVISKHRQVTSIQTVVVDRDSYAVGSGTMYSLEVNELPRLGREPSLILVDDVRNTLSFQTKISVTSVFGQGPIVAGRNVLDTLFGLIRYVDGSVIYPLRHYL